VPDELATVRRPLVVIPPWLAEQMGEREWAIVQTCDVEVMQCLPSTMQDEEERLPPNQRYIVSRERVAYFLIDSTRRRIVG
jgi:hypothetical protein